MFQTIKRLFGVKPTASKIISPNFAKEKAARTVLAEREALSRNAILKGEKMIAFVNNRGTRNMTLSELTEAKRVILLEMQNFSKDAPSLGGNWARGQETLRRIEEARKSLLKTALQKKAS